MEELKTEANTPQQPEPKKKPNTMLIVGINMALLLTVELIFIFSGEDGVLALLSFIPAQFVLCLIIAAIDRKRWQGWVISAFLVLVIGFSTCVAGLSIR